MTDYWRTAGQASRWIPVLNQAETAHAIPTDLLARVAYQESHFIEGIIRGTIHSRAGALGIMQLMPEYFQTVDAAIPFTDADVEAQIADGALFLAHLHQRTGAWPLALAAYNAGLGAVRHYNGVPPYTETVKYVAQITADVPGIAA